MDILPLVVDGIIILIFVACILDGYRRGFVKMLLSVVAIIISATLASALAAPVAQWANEEYVSDITSEYIDSYFDGTLENIGLSEDEFAGDKFEGAEEEIAEAMPEELTQLLEQYDISVEEILSDISPEDTLEEVNEKIKENIEKAVVLPVVELAAFLVIYIICSIILSIIIGVVCTAFRLPVINGINKSFGAVLGVFKGLFVIAVVSVFAVFAAGFFSGNELADAVSEAMLTNTISEITFQLIG